MQHAMAYEPASARCGLAGLHVSCTAHKLTARLQGAGRESSTIIAIYAGYVAGAGRAPWLVMQGWE